MVIAISALATAFAAWYGVQYWLLAADGVTTRTLAIRVDRQTQFGKSLFGDPYRYFASYTFVDADGNRRTGRQSISRERYASLASGRYAPGVEVRYSRRWPFVNTLDVRSARTVFSVLAAFAVMGWAAVAAGYRRATLP